MNYQALKILSAAAIVLGTTASAHASWPQLISGADNNHYDTSVGVGSDGAGNVYVVANVRSATNGSDIVTVKYNRFGVQLWSHTFDSFHHKDDVAESMTVSFDGHVALGGYTNGMGLVDTKNDFLMLSYDSNGNDLGGTYIENPNSGLSCDTADVAFDPSGNVLLAGTVDVPSFGEDYATFKLGADGSYQWGAFYTGVGNNSDLARSITSDSDGNVIVTGVSYNGGNYYDYATVKYSPTGTQLWARNFNGSDSADDPCTVAVDGHDNVIVTGSSDSLTTDIVTVKYRPNGNKLWQARVGTNNINELPHDMKVDAAGNIYVTGQSGSDPEISDVLTFMLDSNGNKLWSKTFSETPKGGSADLGVGIDIDNLGNVYVAAAVRENDSNIGTKYATLKYSPTGARLFVRKFVYSDADGRSIPTGIAVDRVRGKAYVTGSVYNPAGSYFDVCTIKE